MSHEEKTYNLDSSEKPTRDTTDDSQSTIVMQNIYEDGVLEKTYHAKTILINKAIQDIGMGKYQYRLFIVAGFGWFADSVWPLITGLILTPIVNEFEFDVPFLSLAANAGLLVGAMFWGFGADIWGRKFAFNVTLLIAGVFGLAAGGASNFVTLASLMACMGIGVGGNLPVDSAVFLDFIPGPHQYLLTLMSIYWCFGQLFVNLIAWPLIANFSCQIGLDPCTRKENMGWRYLLFTLGGLTLLLWSVRFFVFDLLESPRYLIGKGRNQEAVDVIRRIAKYNGVEEKCTLSVDDLQKVEEERQQKHDPDGRGVLSKTSDFRLGHVKALFATRKLAHSTSILISLWGLIGLASTLYNSFLPFLWVLVTFIVRFTLMRRRPRLASRGAHFGDASLNTAYRNTLIISVVGVPAALFATWAVEIPALGRKGTLAISCALTGAFLLATTSARTSNALLGWNCGYAFFSNIMYGVLYAISPEVFPAKDRGTGTGLVATVSRIFGLVAPIIALYANITTSVPVYISSCLIIFCGAVAMLLPYEPRGTSAM